MLTSEDEIQIRNAVPEDAERIAEIEKQMWLITYPNEEFGISKEDIESKFDRALDRVEVLQDTLTYPDHRYLVAVANNKIVGYFHGISGLNENQVVETYVLPEFQGKNVGKKALDILFQWFGKEKSIFAEIAAYNTRSMNFFKSLGFVDAPGARRKETWNILPSGKEIPLMFMRKVMGSVQE
ncbi:hypothetical protein A2415_05455 [candidate division WWE3 bacterium RIFOXYC1_FULL_39_7]|uniref:N-acetyltransferase domain-containing protein n=2 Tax=Katanobacteria TaxID=422282 RepID=A0A1F4XA55_UNCKA|nr:MAG: hypothetical protein A2415_05455 [candidate division WWE3 bacterium RIFOXYC1_FULL_39_7]OGC78421.1 MAG: hypothetical protein A2619_00975 [candidate division WWE3 bacterium RIFOXYD1_FULL_39_9]